MFRNEILAKSPQALIFLLSLREKQDSLVPNLIGDVFVFMYISPLPSEIVKITLEFRVMCDEVVFQLLSFYSLLVWETPVKTHRN